MTKGLMSLPMYDWPEIRTPTDTYHRHLKNCLSDYGFEAGDHLDRSMDRQTLWQDNRLLMSQTCGLPFVTTLKDQVALIGTPAYDIDCGSGSYYSVLIVHENSPANRLLDVSNKVFAYNDKGSQSGYMALLFAMRSLGIVLDSNPRSLHTGTHRESIKAVATGRADFAAIDAVSWHLAQRHEPQARKVRIVGVTEPTPGLPYITALRRSRPEINHLHLAVVEAMASLAEETRDALLLTGLAHTSHTDYQVIESRFRNILKT